MNRSAIWPAVEQHLCHLARETPILKPDPLVLQVVHLDPIRLEDSQQNVVEMSLNFDSMLSSILQAARVGFFIQINSWQLHVEMPDNALQRIFITLQQLTIVNPAKKGLSVERDCNLQIQIFPSLKLSQRAEYWVGILRKKHYAPINSRFQNLEIFLQATRSQAQEQPSQPKQSNNNLEGHQQLIRKLSATITRIELFNFMSKFEKEAVRELRKLTLENGEDGKKQSFSRETVTALLNLHRASKKK